MHKTHQKRLKRKWQVSGIIKKQEQEKTANRLTFDKIYNCKKIIHTILGRYQKKAFV